MNIAEAFDLVWVIVSHSALLFVSFFTSAKDLIRISRRRPTTWLKLRFCEACCGPCIRCSDPVRRGALSMDGNSPGELKKRKRELNAALAETNRELRMARRRVKNEQRKEETHWKLSTFLVHTLLIIGQLADTPAAVKYLINFG